MKSGPSVPSNGRPRLDQEPSVSTGRDCTNGFLRILSCRRLRCRTQDHSWRVKVRTHQRMPRTLSVAGVGVGPPPVTPGRVGPGPPLSWLWCRLRSLYQELDVSDGRLDEQSDGIECESDNPTASQAEVTPFGLLEAVGEGVGQPSHESAPRPTEDQARRQGYGLAEGTDSARSPRRAASR